MRLQLKKKYIFLLAALVFTAAGFLWARGQYTVPIIMYHHIDDNAAVSRLSVSPESFERQMYFLKRYNYNVVRPDELPDMIKKGKIPPRTIAITFDDGYSDNYKKAYPVLQKLNLPAAIFISPALIGRDGYLTWDQVIEMSESGVIYIGSHTMTHAYLPDLSEQGLDIEISDSRRAIESHIRKNITSFSYPLGGFNSRVRDKVIKSGYKIAMATNLSKSYPRHDIFAMRRLRISKTSDNLFVFWIETSGFYTWIKEHRDKD